MKNSILIKKLVVLSILVLPLLMTVSQKNLTAFAITTSSKVTVNGATVNVRENADISSKIIGKVHQGDTFALITSKNSWDQIKLTGKQTGWVYSAYLTRTETKTATVEAPVLNIRINPSLSSKIVGKLQMGSKITIYDEQSGWAKMGTSSGVQGWVYEYYISNDGSDSNQSQPADVKTTKKNTTSNENLSQSTGSSSSDVNKNSQSDRSASISNSQEPLKGKTIVLDPGHGGNDDGTTSILGTHEKTLTLETAQAVQQKLKNAGAKVIMTRTDDRYIPLKNRADLSNQNSADAFISFHYNWANDPSAKGLTDFYYQKSKDDPLASDILNEVVKTTGLNSDGTKFDDLDVLRNNSQPSTLIELGFLSNKQDDSLVERASYQNSVAQGVYLGLLDYFSSKK